MAISPKNNGEKKVLYTGKLYGLTGMRVNNRQGIITVNLYYHEEERKFTV